MAILIVERDDVPGDAVRVGALAFSGIGGSQIFRSQERLFLVLSSEAKRLMPTLLRPGRSLQAPGLEAALLGNPDPTQDLFRWNISGDGRAKRAEE